MNKKFLALFLTLFVGASVGAWPWTPKGIPINVMEAIPGEDTRPSRKPKLSGSSLRRQAYVVDGSPESRIRAEDRMTSDRYAERTVLKPCCKSGLSREARMAKEKSVLRLGSFAEDIDGMTGAFPKSSRRSPVYGVRSPRHRQ